MSGMGSGEGVGGGGVQTGESTHGMTIAGSSPTSQARVDQVFVGSARVTNATPVLLFYIDLPATGESAKINASIQAWNEGVHSAHGAWDIVGTGQRTSAGVSSRTSTAAGGGSGQTTNSFGGPKPSVGVSDPSSAVAPNVLNRLGITFTGQTGVNILVMWSAQISIGKVV